MVFNWTKRTSTLAGVVALAIVTPGVAMARSMSLPVATHATSVLAAQPASTSFVEQLQLSEQQKQKIRSIRSTRNQGIAKILSATQRTKLQQSLKSGTKLGTALQSLGLSADQKKRIGAIVRKSNQDIEATLTPKQRQQLEAHLKQQRQSTAPIE